MISISSFQLGTFYDLLLPKSTSFSKAQLPTTKKRTVSVEIKLQNQSLWTGLHRDFLRVAKVLAEQRTEPQTHKLNFFYLFILQQ